MVRFAGMTTSILVLVGSLRADSVNRRLAEAIRDQAPEGVTVELVEGLDSLPFYNEDLDGDDVPAAVAALRDARRRAPTGSSS